jgi:hypothetical protein
MASRSWWPCELIQLRDFGLLSVMSSMEGLGKDNNIVSGAFGGGVVKFGFEDIVDLESE